MSHIQKAEKLYYITRDIYERLIKISEKVNRDLVGSISDIIKLAIDADWAVGCGGGYAKLKWLTPEEIRKYQPWNRRVFGKSLTKELILVIPLFITGIEFFMDEFADLASEASKSKQINEKIKERTEQLCIKIKGLAGYAAFIQCVVMGYCDGDIEGGKISCKPCGE